MGFIFAAILAWFETFLSGIIASTLAQLFGGGS
jgi:hypothetical protein